MRYDEGVRASGVADLKGHDSMRARECRGAVRDIGPIAQREEPSVEVVGSIPIGSTRV